MKKNTEISARISEIIEHLGVSPNNFAKLLGYERSQTVYDVISGKSAPSYDFFNRLAASENSAVFSMRWLLTGQGSMLKKESEAVPVAVDHPKAIPLVETYAVGGFGNPNFKIGERDVKDFYVIPKFKDRKIDFMIEVYGSSMYPKYNSGDVVACTIIRNSNFIQWNKVHVIATKEQGILIKRLDISEKENCLKAISDNKDYREFDIPKEEITGLAIVVGVVRLE